MPFPAFKEWHVIVEALGAGEQILLLRKGGIAEDAGAFQVEHRRFWLFPTHFHAQLEKTKPAAARYFPAGPTPPTAHGTVTLRHFAELAHFAFLPDWETVSRLSPHHLWSDACIRERFHASQPAGLHALLVRVHRLAEPLTLSVTPEMAGCKSWVKLPADFDDRPSTPVLDDAAFGTLRALLSL
jgi:hypothetical protein